MLCEHNISITIICYTHYKFSHLGYSRIGKTVNRIKVEVKYDYISHPVKELFELKDHVSE